MRAVEGVVPVAPLSKILSTRPPCVVAMVVSTWPWRMTIARRKMSMSTVAVCFDAPENPALVAM